MHVKIGLWAPWSEVRCAMRIDGLALMSQRVQFCVSVFSGFAWSMICFKNLFLVPFGVGVDP